MRSRKYLGGIVGGCFLFLTLTSLSFGAGDFPAFKDVKDPAEKARIQKLHEGALAEGKLNIVGTMIEPKMAQYIVQGFKEYYGLPGLKNEYTYEGTARIVTRVDQVVNAGRPGPDIVWNVAWAWYMDLMGRNQIMKYESPMYKEYTISNKVGNSMPGYWVSDSYTFHPMWNVDALAKAGIKNFNPTSWWDFTDPKLAKVTAMGNLPRSQSQTSVGIGLRKVLGDEWFKKMAKLKPALFVRTAQGRDWCASGEYPIDIISHAKNAMTVKKAGVNVKLLYPKEGVVLLPLAPIIMASAQHPNTAKLFIDYIRSGPGTNRISESGASLIFGRPGVKSINKEFLPPAEDIKTIPMDWNKDTTQKSIKEFQKWIIDIGLSY
jgi:iron(III) transport system substrate-binding protein